MIESARDDVAPTLAGKVAIVTGGGRDIGRAYALRLASAGAAVAINYHSTKAGADSAVDEIVAGGGRTLAKQGDMTSDEDVSALAGDAVGTLGETIDILVHVTGGFLARKSMVEMDIDHWNRVMDLNATSFVRSIKAVLPHIKIG